MAGSDDTPRMVDARGVKCPLPALYTQKALRRLDPGDCIVVACTDPVSVVDIPNLVREMGCHLERTDQQGDEFRFLIRRTDVGANSFSGNHTEKGD